MKQLLLALSVLGTLAAASPPAGAQISENGPYYALPSWAQQLPADTRFIVLTNWSSAAVLDRETGLVWERAPSTTKVLWVDALFACRGETVGNRRSWRLASYEELTSLLDPSQSDPALPTGNPFQGIGATDNFWTATTDESDSDAAYFVQIASATTFQTALKTGAADLFRPWCVRTGSAVSNPPY
jgi:Protein of unknown function (DUF1566)